MTRCGSRCAHRTITAACAALNERSGVKRQRSAKPRKRGVLGQASSSAGAPGLEGGAGAVGVKGCEGLGVDGRKSLVVGQVAEQIAVADEGEWVVVLSPRGGGEPVGQPID